MDTVRDDSMTPLLRRAARGDRRARDEAITAWLPVARRLALRYVRPEVPTEDLVQVASLGLVSAVDRWDPDIGRSFAAFAIPTILGELRRYFRQNSWTVRPTRDLQELWLEAERARDMLTAELQRSPTFEELVAALGRPPEEVLEALAAGSGREAVSLDGGGRDDEEDMPLEWKLGAMDESYGQIDDRGTVRQLMAGLTERDRAIVWLRFRHELTQREIGDLVGVSQMHVSRLLRASFEAMRQAALSSEARPA